MLEAVMESFGPLLCTGMWAESMGSFHYSLLQSALTNASTRFQPLTLHYNPLSSFSVLPESINQMLSDEAGQAMGHLDACEGLAKTKQRTLVRQKSEQKTRETVMEGPATNVKRNEKHLPGVVSTHVYCGLVEQRLHEMSETRFSLFLFGFSRISSFFLSFLFWTEALTSTTEDILPEAGAVYY